jgi:hypothetical protein
MSAGRLDSVFVFDPHVLPIEDMFMIRVPSGIQSKEDLFAFYEKAGRFPGYFGENWDALLDCLRDFSWISQRNVCILHEDLPLPDDKTDRQVYLEVLEAAVVDWVDIRNRKGPFIEVPDETPYVEHDLFIVFPPSVKNMVNSILGA